MLAGRTRCVGRLYLPAAAANVAKASSEKTLAVPPGVIGADVIPVAAVANRLIPFLSKAW